MIRRLAMVALGLLAVGGFLVLGTGASQDKAGKKFTVEIDNAFGLIGGGDFKVAGVRAGKIKALRLDRRTKRALVDFEITETGFGSLREDVRCEVLPQSLVGEYYVDCEPGKKGQELDAGDTIPVERTTSTVPPDLVNNIMRRPRSERLRLIIGELGAAVSGNARELNAALRRGHPALRETNRVLAILAKQNDILGDLVRDGDRVIGELARNRNQVGRFVVEAGQTARASAERDDDIAAGFRRLPTFLRELRPTMKRLGDVADTQGPALQNLARSSGQLERLFKNLGPFADANRPALRALGKASVVGRRVARKATPVVGDLNRYSQGVPELGSNLAITLEHLDDRRFAAETDPRSPGGQGYTGLEALLQYVFDQTLSTNIHDGQVHILKAFPFEGECAPYADIKAVEEKGEHCGRVLGPTQFGINYRDPTAPPDWDREDRGPEESDPNNGDAPRGSGPGVVRAARRGDDGRRRGDEAPVRMPSLDRILPGAGSSEAPSAPAPAPPKIEGLPTIPVPGAPSTPQAPSVSPSALQRQAGEGLLDYLLGS